MFYITQYIIYSIYFFVFNKTLKNKKNIFLLLEMSIFIIQIQKIKKLMSNFKIFLT